MQSRNDAAAPNRFAGGGRTEIYVNGGLHSFHRRRRADPVFKGDYELFGIVMGIRSPGDYMDEQMVSDLLSINVEVTMLHTVTPIPKIKALALLMQQNVWPR